MTFGLLQPPLLFVVADNIAVDSVPAVDGPDADSVLFF
jgi:hypothetical protein